MMCKIPRNLLVLVIAGACCHLAAQQRSSIPWAGYVNGDWSDDVRAVAVDRDGGVWVAGASSSFLAIRSLPFLAPSVGQPFQAVRSLPRRLAPARHDHLAVEHRPAPHPLAGRLELWPRRHPPRPDSADLLDPIRSA